MPDETTPAVEQEQAPPAPSNGVHNDAAMLSAFQAITDQVANLNQRVEQLTAPQPDTEPNAPAALEQRVESLQGEVERLTNALAEREANSTVEGMGNAPRSQVYGMRTSLDTIREAIEWAVGVEGAQLPPPSLRRLESLYFLTTGDHEWRGIFDQDRVELAAANASTLPGLVVDAMNKVIVSTYNTLATYRWYEMITAVQPNDGSLQDMKWITFGGIGTLPQVPYGSEYGELSVDDSKEADSFAVYGGYVGITRKVLRNSDIAKLQAIPRALTIASVRQRSAHIAGIFTANSGVGPTLDDDSIALFHSSHSNLAATAYSWSAWDAARLECYKQTELGSSKRMGLWPRFWLGPADLYTTALSDFGYGAGPGGKPGTGDNDVNPFAETRPGDPRPIPVAVPDFTNPSNWAYLVDPVMHPVICISYANNPGGRIHPAPELFTVTSPTAGLMFTHDTLPIKVRDEYAYGVATFRGIGKRNV